MQKALKDGRISKNEHGKIDPDVADIEWERNTDPKHSKGRQPKPVEDQATASEPDTPPLAVSKAKREQYLAEMARLELLEREGTLVSAEQARRDGFEVGHSILERVLALPARLGPVLASLDDPREITQRLDADLRDILSALAGGDE